MQSVHAIRVTAKHNFGIGENMSVAARISLLVASLLHKVEEVILRSGLCVLGWKTEWCTGLVWTTVSPNHRKSTRWLWPALTKQNGIRQWHCTTPFGDWQLEHREPPIAIPPYICHGTWSCCENWRMHHFTALSNWCGVTRSLPAKSFNTDSSQPEVNCRTLNSRWHGAPGTGYPSYHHLTR